LDHFPTNTQEDDYFSLFGSIWAYFQVAFAVSCIFIYFIPLVSSWEQKNPHFRWQNYFCSRKIWYSKWNAAIPVRKTNKKKLFNDKLS